MQQESKNSTNIWIKEIISFLVQYLPIRSGIMHLSSRPHQFNSYPPQIIPFYFNFPFQAINPGHIIISYLNPQHVLIPQRNDTRLSFNNTQSLYISDDMKQSANTKQVDGQPAVPRHSLLVLLLPFAILLAPGQLLGVSTLVHLPLSLFAGTFSNHFRNLFKRIWLVSDRYRAICVGRVLENLQALALVLSTRAIGGSLEFTTIDAFVKAFLMRLHDFLYLADQFDFGLLILCDDLAQSLRVMLLGCVGQPQLKLLLLFLKGRGTHEPLAYLLIRLFLHIPLRLRLDFFLLCLDWFGWLFLLGLESLSNSVLSHEGGHLTAEV